jgi:hypothetical protein
LDKKVEQIGALPHQEAAPVFKQMLAALDHAHQAGIIHRDIKPGNVMIKADGQVKMMDFGLAKIQTSASISRSTKTEHIGGTLYYLSPEQVEGKPVDQRSDIYALGMTCYEVLAGCTPLKEKKTTIEILNAIRRDHFPSPTKFNAAVPKELSKIVRKAIALKPKDRFQSTEEMLAAIAELEKKAPPPPRRKIRLVAEILWTIAIVLLTAGVILFTDWDSRLIEALGLSKPTTLTILTEPDSASVRLDGRLVGRTPIKGYRSRLDTILALIQKENYQGLDTLVALQKGREMSLIFRLQALASDSSKKEVFHEDSSASPPEVGALHITAEPRNAFIFLEGKHVGRTRYINDAMPVGQYRIMVRHEGHRDSTLTLIVRQDKPQRARVKLARFMGILKVLVKPYGSIHIDDKLHQEDTDLEYVVTLPVGPHKVRAEHPIFGRREREIDIRPNQAKELVIDFLKE